MKRLIKSFGFSRLKGVAASIMLLSAFPICESPTDPGPVEYNYDEGYDPDYRKITGFVYDRETGRPIIDARVQGKDLSRMASTDSSGYYTYYGVTGCQTLVAIKYGYYPDSGYVCVESGQEGTLDIHLREKE